MPSASHALPLSRLLVEAARCVRSVLDGRSLDTALAHTPPAMRPGVQALSYEALRRLGDAKLRREGLVSRAPQADVESLLLVALALASQPEGEASYASHTLVDETVKAARRMQPRAADFVNAVLRRHQRERGDWDTRVSADPAARLNHPAWWIKQIQRDWPEEAETILSQSRRMPPMTLRVNAQKVDTERYRQALEAVGLQASRVVPGRGHWSAVPERALDHALLLERPCPVERLPGFEQGHVSVQDAAAQVAAPLLLCGLPAASHGRGLRVLDACAAPGGKTAHLLECDPSLRVTALDVDRQRLERVRSTLDRLGLRADLLAADAAQPDTWWDGQAFDAILLDAPCTASGIVRRHPDIPWLRRESDIANLAATQARLLDALWPLLTAGGVMVYATCSVFKAEGEAQIDAFLQRVSESPSVLDPASPGHLRPLPDNPSQATAAYDGFFLARLIKPVA